jgi:hypothetical protein
MVKSNLIVGVAAFLFMLFGGLVSAVCCVAGPVLAVAFGLAAGFLCAYFEKPVDAEKAIVRGAISGTITGAVALVAHFIGLMVAQLAMGSNVACLPGMCAENGVAVNPASVTLFAVFNSCFYGLLVLAIMSGFGAVGGGLWTKTLGKPKAGTPTG